LWFFEGITSYFDDLILVRSGLIDQKRYLGLLCKTLTRVQRGAGRLTQSLSDSSFDAWHKFYKQDENAPNAIVSYYAKGALLALCLDSLMRQYSDNAVSLDDLMLNLWQRWLDNGEGLDEQQPQKIAASLLGNDKLDDFFNAALYSTEDLPLQSALSQLGVKLEWRARTSSDDMGGVLTAEDKSATEAVTPWLGATIQDAPGGVKILQVMTGSPAERAGLAANDLLIAMADLSVSKVQIDGYLQRFSNQPSIGIHYFRLGQLRYSELVLESAPKDTAMLGIVNETAVRKWLTDQSGHTDVASA
jgi:predicted metalloprotease with PDZ domain